MGIGMMGLAASRSDLGLAALRPDLKRGILPVLAAATFLCSGLPAAAAGQHLEKHFTVNARPVVVIHNVEASLLLTVPEETELQLKTETGLIYVEQVMGDMTLESVAGDVHLKEVSGYIIVRTTEGSLVCTLCAGKLDFKSISGGAQVLQPALTNVSLFTTSGNILFDGDFVRTGLYTMKSGKGLVEVRFSGNDSFDLKAQTATGTVDNRAAAYLKPDSHGVKHLATKFTKGLFGTVGQGLAKVELSSYSGTIRILKRD